MKLIILTGALTGALFFTGCAQGAKKTDLAAATAHPEKQWTAVKLAAPVVLRFGEQKGMEDSNHYTSDSVSDTFEGGELRLHANENTSFDAHTATTAGDEQKFTQVISVDNKVGTSDLHEMAMPDLGEKLEMSLTRDGKVLSAGGYPHNSIFYVPQISLPVGPVAVGDTWEMQAAWVSLDGEYPFSMTMVSIFKGVYACGPKENPDQCADIEMSGQIAAGGDGMPVIGFKNDWRGRMLFAIKAGEVVWSNVVSSEEYSADTLSRKVQTTLETKLTDPAGLLPANLLNLSTQPK